MTNTHTHASTILLLFPRIFEFLVFFSASYLYFCYVILMYALLLLFEKVFNAVKASSSSASLPVAFVRLEVVRNHGNDEYTCVYRFRVHAAE